MLQVRRESVSCDLAFALGNTVALYMPYISVQMEIPYIPNGLVFFSEVTVLCRLCRYSYHRSFANKSNRFVESYYSLLGLSESWTIGKHSLSSCLGDASPNGTLKTVLKPIQLYLPQGSEWKISFMWVFMQVMKSWIVGRVERRWGAKIEMIGPYCRCR